MMAAIAARGDNGLGEALVTGGRDEGAGLVSFAVTGGTEGPMGRVSWEIALGKGIEAVGMGLVMFAEVAFEQGRALSVKMRGTGLASFGQKGGRWGSVAAGTTTATALLK
jgi:hypothetical protein